MRSFTISSDSQNAAGVLVLRLGLAWFLLVWGINKFLAPGHYVKLYAYFHDLEIGATMPYYMGAGQTLISVAIALGLWRRVSYGLGLVLHTVTMAVILESVLAPFLIEDGYPSNRNQSIAVAAWCGFVALYFLRSHDAWSLDRWFQRRRRFSDGQES